MTEILYPLTKTVGGFAAPAAGPSGEDGGPRLLPRPGVLAVLAPLTPVPGVLPARRQVLSKLLTS